MRPIINILTVKQLQLEAELNKGRKKFGLKNRSSIRGIEVLEELRERIDKIKEAITWISVIDNLENPDRTKILSLARDIIKSYD